MLRNTHKSPKNLVVLGLIKVAGLRVLDVQYTVPMGDVAASGPERRREVRDPPA